MAQDDHFGFIEHRLRREAQNLGAAPSAPLGKLVTEHNHRIQRQRAWQGVGFVTAACVIGAAFLAWSWLGSRDARVPGSLAEQQEISAQDNELVARPVREGSPTEARVSLMSTLPLFLIQVGADGQEVITPCIFVPEHTRQVDLQELSPPIQRAVRLVLGLEDKELTDSI